MTKLLVLGTADWNQPIATNQHYMVRELAQSFPITFTESMGLRTPELSGRDLRRVCARFGLLGARGHSAMLREVPGTVTVRSPRVLPRHVGLAARYNRPRMHRLVKDWVDERGPKVLWTYSPVIYGLDQYADHVIYHCVDLLGEVKGIPSTMIEQAERSLARRADVAIGSSAVVVQHLQEMGFRSLRHWPNVADTGTISGARPEVIRRVANRVVFAGNLSAAKVNFSLLADLMTAGVDLHLAGPVSEGGGSASREVGRMVELGATYHGMLSLTELAKLYWTSTVGLIPYIINEYTRGVSPLKTFEYMAAGLGVVSTPVPALTPRLGHVSVASAGRAFVDAVISMTEVPSDATVRLRRQVAEQNSWTRRGETARELVWSMATPA